MEAFVGFTPTTDVKELGKTLESWDIGDIEPIGIQCQPKKFELQRRIAAEGMSVGDYLLIDVGCIPESLEEIQNAIKSLYPQSGESIGMVGKTGARVCRKGIIDKWPMKSSATYDAEHIQAYEIKGYKVIEWPLYKRIIVC